MILIMKLVNIKVRLIKNSEMFHNNDDSGCLLSKNITLTVLDTLNFMVMKLKRQAFS